MKEFPTEDKLVCLETPPKEIDMTQGFAKPAWISPVKRYWITRTNRGYTTHLQALAPGSGGGMSWCYSYTADAKPYTKSLSGSVKRIEKLIKYHAECAKQGEAQNQ